MTKERTPKNLKEARAMGYRFGRTAWTRGYVTRKGQKVEDVMVYTAGTGELYVLAPSWASTRYCIRQYLVK